MVGIIAIINYCCCFWDCLMLTHEICFCVVATVTYEDVKPRWTFTAGEVMTATRHSLKVTHDCYCQLSKSVLSVRYFLMRPHCFGQTSEVEPFWRMLAWQLSVWQLLFRLCAALEDSLAVCCQVWRDCRVSLCSHRVVGDKGCCGAAIRVLMSSEFTWWMYV